MKKYLVTVDEFIDMDIRWTESIELSGITAKEQQKSKQGSMTKNISLILSIMDKEVIFLE